MTFGKVVMKLRDTIFSSVNKMSIKASRLPDFHPGGTKNLDLRRSATGLIFYAPAVHHRLPRRIVESFLPSGKASVFRFHSVFASCDKI